MIEAGSGIAARLVFASVMFREIESEWRESVFVREIKLGVTCGEK